MDFCETRQEIKIFREVIAAPEPQADEKTRELLGSFLGDYSSTARFCENTVMTAGYREYTGREPMEPISWKQSAHSMGLMVREYDHTVEPVFTLLLNVETAQERKEPVLETCYSLARTVCQELEDRGIKYVFCTNGSKAGAVGGSHMVREGLGHQHFLKVLEILGHGMYHPAFSKEKLAGTFRTGYFERRDDYYSFPRGFRECGQLPEDRKDVWEWNVDAFGCERGGAEHDLDASSSRVPDLSFFGMFAGAAASYLLQRIGGMDTQILPRSILGLGILSLIYGISFIYRRKRKKEVFLLPFLALSFVGAAGCLAELVVLVPGAAYVATMIIKREYPLFWSRQAEYVSGILESCIDFQQFSSAGRTVENFFTDYLAIGCLHRRRRTDSAFLVPYAMSPRCILAESFRAKI